MGPEFSISMNGEHMNGEHMVHEVIDVLEVYLHHESSLADDNRLRTNCMMCLDMRRPYAWNSWHGLSKRLGFPK